ncbi:MAG: prefoldin subunit alpha [Thaumarchaeota archaeon]|nr:prefoldin subunit alpha [Nitrososphaerota archaeon]
MQSQSDVENRINELANAIQVLENYYESIISRIYLIGQAIEETKAAQLAIETLPEDKESEIVVPLGGDVLLKTKVDSSSKIMLKVGGGVLMVKNKDYALNFLKERIEELEKALSNAQQDKKAVEEKLEGARYELSELLKRVQNVR